MARATRFTMSAQMNSKRRDSSRRGRRFETAITAMNGRNNDPDRKVGLLTTDCHVFRMRREIWEAASDDGFSRNTTKKYLGHLLREGNIRAQHSTDNDNWSYHRRFRRVGPVWCVLAKQGGRAQTRTVAYSRACPVTGRFGAMHAPTISAPGILMMTKADNDDE